MDLTKAKKPIHFTCPKCHADFEFSGGEIVRKKNELKHDVSVLAARMQAHKNEYGKDRYYHSLVKQHKEKMAQYIEAREMVQLASEQSEIQLFGLFKAACRRRFGKEVINEMLEECEEEMSYSDYDTAIQRYNNFNGV